MMMEDPDSEYLLEDQTFVAGGVNDVDHEMMDTLFDLSACLSSDDDDDDDDESDSTSHQVEDATHGQGWTYLIGNNRTPAVTISIDGVDQRLLDRARQEVPEVLQRIKKKVFGTARNRDMSKVSPGNFLKAFMDPHLLGYMKTFINTNMSSDPVSSSDIIAFIRVELMLSFYKVTPGTCCHVLLMLFLKLTSFFSSVCPGVAFNVL
jgi:hypothetical protein